MFLRAKCVLCLILALLGLGVVYSTFFHPIINDQSSKYKRFSSVKAPKISDGIYQHREGVVKDLWVSKNDERLLYHFESPSSQFQCIDGEMVETSGQTMLQTQNQSMTSSACTFYYKRKLLEAEGAQLASLPDFQGETENISMYCKSYPPTMITKEFTAHYQDATFRGDEATHTKDQIVLKGHVEMEHDKGLHITSDTLILNMEKTKAVQITFKENVKLFNNEIIGIAESAVYDFIDRSIQLTAEADKEVLFYNKEQSFSMAAPKILIEGDSVRGVGKVRFTFEESERENILNLLQACLKNTF